MFLKLCAAVKVDARTCMASLPDELPASAVRHLEHMQSLVFSENKLYNIMMTSNHCEFEPFATVRTQEEEEFYELYLSNRTKELSESATHEIMMEEIESSIELSRILSTELTLS